MSRFLVYTAPAVGHVLPYVPGLLELQARGHDVHVRTLPDVVEPLRAAGLDAAPIDWRVIDVEVTDPTSGRVDPRSRGKYDGPDLQRAIGSSVQTSCSSTSWRTAPRCAPSRRAFPARS